MGNLLLTQMMGLIRMLIAEDIPFTIESPIQSLLWKTDGIKEVLALKHAEDATVD